MDEAINMTMPLLKQSGGVVSVLDESLFTGGPKPYKVYCTADPGFISVAVVDTEKNRFTGFEGFHFDKLLSEDQLARKISGLALQSSILKKVSFRDVSVMLGNNRFTFIPSALFKEGDAKDFFYFNQKKVDTDSSRDEKIYFDKLRGYDAVNIFGVPGSIHSAFMSLFDKFSIHHQLTAVMEAARLYSSKQSSIPLYIHLHSSVMDVVVLDERKLVFANSFGFKTVDDAIYFAMMVCEQLALNPEKTGAILSGEIESDSSFARQLAKFLPQLSFAERTRTAAFTYGFDNLPGHFYHSAFSHLLCES